MKPVSYIILSKRGTRDEFLRMVQRCRAAGVRVLVDAVINREHSFRFERSHANASILTDSKPKLRSCLSFAVNRIPCGSGWPAHGRARRSWFRKSVFHPFQEMVSPGTFLFQRFEHYEYPGIFQAVDFHECRPNGDKEIKSYQ